MSISLAPTDDGLPRPADALAKVVGDAAQLFGSAPWISRDVDVAGCLEISHEAGREQARWLELQGQPLK